MLGLPFGRPGARIARRREGGVDRGDLDRLVEGSEARFEAALAAEEDSAAADLAFSLRQDANPQTLLTSGPWSATLSGGGAAPIESVGPDVAIARAPSGSVILIPLGRLIAIEGTGARPESGADGLVALLRRQARFGASLRLETEGGSLEGVPISVSTTHVLLDRRVGRCLVGLDSVIEVWLDG